MNDRNRPCRAEATTRGRTGREETARPRVLHAVAAPDVDELHERLDAMQQQLAEVVERQEFTERLLSKVRQERGLPGAGGAEG